jgi:hypothetical protein
MARQLQQDARQAVPGLQEVQAMLRVCEALRDHFRALIKANCVFHAIVNRVSTGW